MNILKSDISNLLDCTFCHKGQDQSSTNVYLILMAFPQSNVQRELARSKILEELQNQKKQLLKQGAAPQLNSAPLTVPVGVQNSDGHPMNFHQQRAALQTAHAQSMGSFISQDSLFGNLILPVLPRFDQK